MNNDPIFDHNRVILCHFDSYSCALNFARYGNSIIMPTPLPEGASAMPPAGEATELQTPSKVFDALIAKTGLNPAQLKLDADFEAWMSGDSGAIRIHLVRFTTPDIPRSAIEPLGGIFKSISEMRGMPMLELNLMRQVFNLIIGG